MLFRSRLRFRVVEAVSAKSMLFALAGGVLGLGASAGLLLRSRRRGLSLQFWRRPWPLCGSPRAARDDRSPHRALQYARLPRPLASRAQAGRSIPRAAFALDHGSRRSEAWQRSVWPPGPSQPLRPCGGRARRTRRRRSVRPDTVAIAARWTRDFTQPTGVFQRRCSASAQGQYGNRTARPHVRHSALRHAGCLHPRIRSFFEARTQ